jgi:hypothetical protein
MRSSGMALSRRDLLLSLALLASAPLVFGLFIRNAFPPQGPWEWMIAVPMFWPMMATFLAASALGRGVRALPAPAFGALVYLACGLVYMLLRPHGQMQGPPAALFWPTLFLWQDLCRTGAWGCPVG